MNKIVKEKIKEGVTLLLIIIAFSASLWIMLKYNNEGEKNMPFNLSKILVISSAETEQKKDESEESKWKVNINQYNDFYIEFTKNENKNETNFIKSVTIENINFSSPNKGKVYMYMPSSKEDEMFTYEDNYMVTNSLTYKGEVADNLKTLSIGNQGGTILFRIINRNVSEYTLKQDEELNIDGTLLQKSNIKMKDVKFDISFDIRIETMNNTYIGNVKTELPIQNVEKEGVVKTNIDNVIFKRN